MTTISVIIPAYNQGHYLGEAIQSVLDQTIPDWEIAIVDDGSQDNTRDVVLGFSDPRIHYYYQENRGLSAARNTGIRNTTAPLVTFLDSDDCFCPEKLYLLTGIMSQRPEIGMAAGQALLIDQNRRKLDRATHAQLSTDLSELLLGNPLHVGSVLLRREWLNRVGYFDESLLACEDWDLWLRLAQAGCQIACIQQPVSLYRIHIGQMTRESDRMRIASLRVLDKVFNTQNLPEGWRRKKDQAYSQHYLISAMHFYRVANITQAIDEMKKVIQFYPKILDNKAELLAEKINIWANDVRIADPVKFLREIYDHLPDELDILYSRRRTDLGKMAMKMAYEAYSQGKIAEARCSIWRAFWYQPNWLKNRGALSIFFRSLLTLQGNISWHGGKHV